MSESVVKHSKVNMYDYFFANKKRKTYTNIGISLILIIIFLVFALRPTISTVGTIKKKTADYKQYNELAEKKIVAARNLQSQLNLSSAESENGLKEEISFLDKVYMYDYSLKTIYKNLVERASGSNVVIRGLVPVYKVSEITTEFGFDASADAPSLTKYELNISAEGADMTSMSKFLGTLEGAENMPILSRVSSIIVVDGIASESLKEALPESQQSTNTVKSITASILLVVYLDPSRLPEEIIQ